MRNKILILICLAVICSTLVHFCIVADKGCSSYAARCMSIGLLFIPFAYSIKHFGWGLLESFLR